MKAKSLSLGKNPQRAIMEVKLMKNSKGTPTKDTGTKNNNSDNDVDFKNTSSKKQGKSNVADSATDYKYHPKVENPDPKAESYTSR